MRLSLPVGSFALLLLAATPLAAQRPCDSPAPDSLGPSRDLYCIELIAPPGIHGVTGRVELSQPPGPFTVAVTADGRLRYLPILSVAGLPAPSSLGPYRTFVAWAAAPTMTPVIRLGEVGKGTTTLPVIDLEKFIILISAERSAAVKEPSDRLVLRGQSPSTRLFPPDLLEFTIGSAPSSGTGDTSHDMSMHRQMSDSAASRWTGVPMPAGLTMLPAEMALRPDVSPYLPTGNAPAARPREVVHLAGGDTVRLEAGLVRRNIMGREYTMFAFNGQYPGPLIETTRGAQVTVIFSNHLPQLTSVHWHGIRLDNASDGTPGLTQPALAPGDSFTYRLRFPDSGIYWYHPHVREDVQQELGLYGNILVRSPGSDFGPADREEVLILDDLLVNASGLVPMGGEAPTHALMGRFGNLMLVNGEPDYRLDVKRGEVIRFFLTNAANARVFNLS
ncbi:MAG: multicopper oxidase family protein, partial [Gemmatimonadales bacterium]